jgi:riboflavin biosynthesis pyrimidine reductase
MRALFEAAGLPRLRLPESLRQRYGGELALADEVVYANFVSSLDGVVALGDERESGSLISGKNDDDRFMMGLLRAFADAVLIGASTLRAEPTHVLWTPDFIYPALKEEFAELRRSLGRSDGPRLAVVTSKQRLDSGHEALRDALIITPSPTLPTRGREKKAAVSPAEMLERLRKEGFRRVLCEGGPSLFGQLVGAGAVDELFLTVSPVLAGRDRTTYRQSLVESVALPSGGFAPATLRSVRASGSYLFLRYQLRQPGTPLTPD